MLRDQLVDLRATRLVKDQEVLLKAYPDLLPIRTDPATQTTFIEGYLTFIEDCGIKTKVRVRVIFPDLYPLEEPRAYDRYNLFPHVPDRHFYPDSQCCLWFAPESKWKPENLNALVHFIDQVASFFDKQLIIEAGHSGWPGRERRHGYLAHLDYFFEKLGTDLDVIFTLKQILMGTGRYPGRRLCPCNSGRKYRKCHQGAVNDVRSAIPLVVMDIVFGFLAHHKP